MALFRYHSMQFFYCGALPHQDFPVYSVSSSQLLNKIGLLLLG